MTVKTLPPQPKVGMVSLGCPKALVDSERILTKLRADGYGLSPDYAGADVVLVNTCGFLDSAKEESLEAIGEAMAENGRVIVTGCMGNEAEVIRARFPNVLAVTGEHSNHIVDRDILRAFRHKDFCNGAFIDGFDFHRRLVGFDFGDHIAGLDLVALFLEPLRKVALLHGG